MHWAFPVKIRTPHVEDIDFLKVLIPRMSEPKNNLTPWIFVQKLEKMDVRYPRLYME